MKLFSTLIFASVFLAAVVAQDEPLKGVEIKIVEVSHSGAIVVETRNASGVPVRIWRESGSLGADRWRVLRIRKGQLETFFQNPNQRFTRNAVVPVEIGVGARIQQRLDLNGGNWCGFGHCSAFNEHGFGGREASFEPRDIVVVIYDVPRTDEATKMGIWYGVTAALTTVQ